MRRVFSDICVPSCPPPQIDRSKKPSVRVTDGSRPTNEPSAKDSPLPQNGPVVPDRSVKPAFESGRQLSEEERQQIHAEAAGVRDKARRELEQRRRAQEEEEEKMQREEEERRRRQEQDREKEEAERKRREEEEEEKRRQERGRLERQKAEEEDQVGEERMRRGQRTQNGEVQPKSVSLDSPMPNNVVSDIKVGLIRFPVHVSYI